MSSVPYSRVPFSDLGALHQAVRPELDAVWADVTNRSAFVGGDYLSTFEAEWADYCTTEHAIGVANGTDALALALMALGIEQGDEVLVPSNTFVATAEAVVMAGASPVFVDVDPSTLLVTPETLEAGRTRHTKAVLPVHLYGHMVDMDSLNAWAGQYGLLVVEDAAQAHGARWQGRRAGSFGVAAGFSFYPGKNLGAFGDGGAVVTKDAVVAERVRSLSNHGRSQVDRYAHSVSGVNSRLDGLQAGLLSVKLRQLDDWTTLRRAVAAGYRERLGDLWELVVDGQPGSESVWHLFVMRVPDRAAFQASLDERGIDTSVHYPVPCHRQDAFKRLPERALPECEAAAEEIVSLPFFPHMTDDQLDRVVGAVRAALAG